MIALFCFPCFSLYCTEIVGLRVGIRIRIRMSFIGQVCLHIRGICYSDKAPQCNRMTATGQDTDNKRTIYKYTYIYIYVGVGVGRSGISDYKNIFNAILLIKDNFPAYFSQLHFISFYICHIWVGLGLGVG